MKTIFKNQVVLAAVVTLVILGIFIGALFVSGEFPRNDDTRDEVVSTEDWISNQGIVLYVNDYPISTFELAKARRVVRDTINSYEGSA